MTTVSLSEPLEFRFVWLNDQGAETGLFSKKGSFDGTTLTLDNKTIPIALILDVRTREKYFYFTTAGAKGFSQVGLSLRKISADELKRSIDIARSSKWAEHHRQALADKGRGNAFRQSTCPNCSATLTFENMPNTPQMYCHFCDSVMTAHPNAETHEAERHLRLCEECGMYSKPRKFLIFYFYFLVIFYGYNYHHAWRCSGCMRREAWKMLAGNFLFVLGLPVALVQLFRSYRDPMIGGAYRGLDAANIRAGNGDMLGAIEIYRQIIERAPNCAGVKYNVGTALMRQGKFDQAASALEASLADCSNYVPAFQMLSHCYQQTGAREKLEALRRQWSAEETEPAIEPEATASAES